MDNYKELMITRLKFLDGLLRDKKTADKVDSVVYVRISRGKPQFYLSSIGDSNTMKYISRDQSYLVSDLVNREYRYKLYTSATKERDAIMRFLKGLGLSNQDIDLLRHGKPVMRLANTVLTPEEVYDSFHPAKQDVIVPHPKVLPDSLFIKEWESKKYEGLPFNVGSSEYYSDKGERMRSKSEVIIANTLARKGIPYRYECPLQLPDCVMYPDFTTLNIRTRKEYYWEHFGMLSDPGYLNKTLIKLRKYESAGYYPGEKLLITRESISQPLSTKNVQELIDHFLR